RYGAGAGSVPGETKVVLSLWRAALFALLTLAVARPGWADPTSAPPAAITISSCPANPLEQADERVAQDALDAFNAAPNAPYDALRPRLQALRDVMSHTPTCFPEFELRGDRILVRTGDQAKFLELSVLLASDKSRPAHDITMVPNTYLVAALLLA